MSLHLWLLWTWKISKIGQKTRTSLLRRREGRCFIIHLPVSKRAFPHHCHQSCWGTGRHNKSMTIFRTLRPKMLHRASEGDCQSCYLEGNSWTFLLSSLVWNIRGSQGNCHHNGMRRMNNLEPKGGKQKIRTGIGFLGKETIQEFTPRPMSKSAPPAHSTGLLDTTHVTVWPRPQHQYWQGRCF